MDHKEYREKLPLLLYGELSNGEQSELNHHLNHCTECADAYEELQMLQSTVDSARVPRVSEELLNEARLELRAALRMERSRQSWKDIWTERLQGWFPMLRISFAAMASLAFGIFIGYKAIAPPQVEQPQTTAPVTSVSRCRCKRWKCGIYF
jgi:anti-sigma factor RsiW